MPPPLPPEIDPPPPDPSMVKTMPSLALLRAVANALSSGAYSISTALYVPLTNKVFLVVQTPSRSAVTVIGACLV